MGILRVGSSPASRARVVPRQPRAFSRGIVDAQACRPCRKRIGRADSAVPSLSSAHAASHQAVANSTLSLGAPGQVCARVAFGHPGSVSPHHQLQPVGSPAAPNALSLCGLSPTTQMGAAHAARRHAPSPGAPSRTVEPGERARLTSRKRIARRRAYSENPANARSTPLRPHSSWHCCS